MFVDVNGLNMHVRIDGPADAPALVLLHLLGTDLRVWEEKANALSKTYRVIRPDLRGHGLTEVPHGPYTIENMAWDVLDLLTALGISVFYAGGLSVGGMIAQSIAAQAPARVAALILCDTALRILPPQSWLDRASLVRAQGIGVIQDAVIARWVTPGFV